MKQQATRRSLMVLVSINVMLVAVAPLLLKDHWLVVALWIVTLISFGAAGAHAGLVWKNKQDLARRPRPLQPKARAPLDYDRHLERNP